MTLNPVEGIESHLYAEEELVTFYDWLDLFLKVAEKLEQEFPLKFSVEGNDYSRIDYWRGLAYKCFTQQPTKAALNELNKILMERDGIQQVRLGGTYTRYKRVVPNTSQMNTFIKRLPKAFKARMGEEIFRIFCEEALKLGLISKNITVYIDFTNKFFYGLLNAKNEEEITGTNKGPGTKWTRKYGAFMINSGTTRFFAGLFLSKKGHSKVPDILRGIELLRQWGFNVVHSVGDREFTCYDIVASLTARHVRYLGSIKHTPAVKKAINAYLAGKTKSVIQFTLNPSAKTQYKLGPVDCHLIMKPDRGTRLRDLQKQIAAGKLTVDQAMEHVHTFVTTMPPPRERRRLVHWGLGLLKKFSKRWRIETAFRDLKRILPANHARNHATKTFMFVFQMIVYNAWQFQRALHRKLRRVPKSYRMGPTLERFSKRIEDQVRVGACAI
jgi:hypothetical protein